MKKRYFAWKNGKRVDGEQDWTEITQEGFIKICSENRKLKQEERRYFYQIPGLEDGDYYLFLECTYEQYKESRAERYQRIKKLKELEELEAQGQLYHIVSLDAVIEDGSGDSCTLHDLIADPESVFEDRLILSIDVNAALEMLSAEELDIVEMLYLSEYAISERELARQMGTPQKTLNNKKQKILRKLKKSLAHSY